MKRRHRSNFFLIICAVLTALIIYFLFMSERAVAPAPQKGFASPVASVEAQNFQSEDQEQLSAFVLMYHHIGPLPSGADDIRRGLTVSSEEFDLQLKYLSENNYQFTTLSRLNEAIQNQNIPLKPVVLTFDDGYDDNFKEALPILKKYNAVGTFFIISSKIGQAEYMTKEQVLELGQNGNEIGSHTIDHLDLAKLKGSALDKQMKDSKTKLEEMTGMKITSFSYPAGKYNDETIKKVAEAGYNMAVTTHASSGNIFRNNLLEIPRYRISANMSLPALLR